MFNSKKELSTKKLSSRHLFASFCETSETEEKFIAEHKKGTGLFFSF